MSWSIYLTINTGIEDREVADVGNMTYNVSPMYYKAFETEDGIRGLNGTTCKESLPLITKAVKAMKMDPKTYEALNPENGWGNYQGALDFLEKLKVSCEENPLCIIRVF